MAFSLQLIIRWEFMSVLHAPELHDTYT
jgi:hypothetical protein